jgi:hypothetical protein
MVNQYASAPDSKMKNRAIWSKTVVEDAGMWSLLLNFGTNVRQGVKNARP